MTAPASEAATIAINTNLALLDQFMTSLSPDTQHDLPLAKPDAPSPLLLLGAATKSLKAQVTKISLLAITTPFTPSALVTCLSSINNSVLPSLVTATLITTGQLYTVSFATECHSLTRCLLRDLKALVKLVEARHSEGEASTDLSEAQKREITGATGKVWEDCDTIVAFANGRLPVFVVRKAKQWLALMKDAVKELQEWDPDEDFDDEDIFGDAAHSDDEADDASKDKKGDDRATISAGVKHQALKVLERIPQSVHVVIKQRLEPLKQQPPKTLPVSSRKSLEEIVIKARKVSEAIDESAEGMYLGDLELCLKKAGEARAVTIEMVQAASKSFIEADGDAATTQEDKYVQRALEWIRQVDTTKTLPSR